MQPKLLTIQEVADQLRLSRLTVYRYISSGKLPAFKLGRDFRISQDEVIDFLNNRKTNKGEYESDTTR